MQNNSSRTHIVIPLFLAYLLLYGWAHYYQQLNCLVAILLMSCVLFCMANSMWESALMRRQTFLSRYLISDSPFFYWFKGGVFMLLWQVSKATFFTLFLLMEVIFWPTSLWIILLIDIIIISLCYPYYKKRIKQHVKKKYSDILIRQYLLFINSLLIVILIMPLYFFSAHKNYHAYSLISAISEEVKNIHCHCNVVESLVQLATTKEVASWWTIQSVINKINPPYLIFSLWLLFFCIICTFVWGYNRMILGTLSNPFWLLQKNQ